MWQLQISPLELIARSAIVFVAFLIVLRIFGKREIGQFTFFDLALILLVANALQPAMTGPDSSVPGGVIIMVTIFGLNRGVAELRDRSEVARRLLESQPTVLARDGEWLPDALRREGMDITDGEAALREHGIDSIDKVRLVELEPDGSVSVVSNDDDGAEARRRRRRYRRRF